MSEGYDEMSDKLDDGRVISTVKESNITSRDPRTKPVGTGPRIVLDGTSLDQDRKIDERFSTEKIQEIQHQLRQGRTDFKAHG